MYCSSNIVFSQRSSGESPGRFCAASRSLCGIQMVEHMGQDARCSALQQEEPVEPPVPLAKAESKKESLVSAFHCLYEIVSQPDFTHGFTCFCFCPSPVLLQYQSCLFLYHFYYLFPLPCPLCELAGPKQRPLWQAVRALGALALAGIACNKPTSCWWLSEANKSVAVRPRLFASGNGQSCSAYASPARLAVEGI